MGRATRAAWAAALLAGATLAGCAAPARLPPVMVVEELRHWFEGDLLVVNVTFANHGRVTPGAPIGTDPLLEVNLAEWRTRDPSAQPGRQHEHVGFASASLTLSTAAQEPPRHRYYHHAAQAWNDDPRHPGEKVSPGAVGPVQYPPGSRGSAEFVFLPKHRFQATEGYYVIDARFLLAIDQPGPEHGPRSRGSERYTGCFNHDTPPFYALHPTGGPSCPHYDATGEDTHTALAQEGFGRRRADGGT